ncbi:MAG: polyprenyl synthetase family protein [Nitrospirae bacterium]|nr:polyprenyl synthetase family protein [Nitrospirota bacterium]
MSIQEVWEAFRSELQEVEEELQGSLRSHTALIPDVARHLLGSGGKRLRPLLVLLSARLCGYRGREDRVLGAVVELIHSASLLHDDVVDHAEVRRGRPVANLLWNNQTAILVGDYLYSKALRLAVGLGSVRVMETLSEASLRMAEGEVLDLVHSGDLGLSETEYLDLIEAKTAALIAASCRLGAVLAGRGVEQEEALYRYGMGVGMAFQIADDVLDYTAEEKRLGKALGKDLREGKVTLPVIRFLEKGRSEETQRVRRLLAARQFTAEDLADICGMLRDSGALAYAVSRAREYARDAVAALEAFEGDPLRQSLAVVAEYVIDRDS